MGKIEKAILSGIAITSLLGLLYFITLGVMSWKQGYSWEEMDWHQKGNTSIVDFFSAVDIGKREILVNGKPCAEYYAYKDGLPIKVMCHPKE